MTAYRRTKSGFTLVEILIVVIILGILAAIVIPQFTNASTDAKKSSVSSQLQTLRSSIQLFKLEHNDAAPDLVTDWTPFTMYTDALGNTQATKDDTFKYGPYMLAAPVNPLNGETTAAAAAADGVGWVYDTTTGVISATNLTETLVYDEAAATVE